mgnify:CR=1 FL=1
MDLSTITGLLLGGTCVAVALVLGGSFGAYVDPVALLIVIGGAAAIEQAAAAAGVNIVVPVTPGRGDATAQLTDVESFALLEPTADAFRNYYDASQAYRSAPEMLVDKAEQLQLTVPEMTALLGGLRGLSANTGSRHANDAAARHAVNRAQSRRKECSLDCRPQNT